MYNIIYEMRHQSRFDAGYWMLGAGAVAWPRGMIWGGRREGGSGWGTHVHPWQMHVDVWQNQYNIVKLLAKRRDSNCHQCSVKLPGMGGGRYWGQKYTS